MYRAVVYCLLNGESIRLNSQSTYEIEEANTRLDALLALPGFTGGHVEVHVPNIGWVIEDEVESILYLYRMRESDRELNGVDVQRAVDSLLGVDEAQEQAEHDDSHQPQALDEVDANQ